MNIGQHRGLKVGRLLGDRLVTSRLLRWTWSGLKPSTYSAQFTDFRPADGDSVSEMLSGRYLLGSRLIDTRGGSPFSVTGEEITDDWFEELHSFSWLRHFRNASTDAGRSLAQTLVFDWIARYAQFDRRTWTVRLTAQRVINWLRHLSLISVGATNAQLEALNRAIALQVQSVRLRVDLSTTPQDEMLAHILLVAAALADGSGDDTITAASRALRAALSAHLGKDHLVRTRNAVEQIELLTELVTLRQAIGQRDPQEGPLLGELVEGMLSALSGLILGTAEPGYFNGTGHMSSDVLLSLQMHGSSRRTGNSLVSGYGLIRQGPAIVLMDAGHVPDAPYATHAHAGALSFEFSYANQLIVGNCGPAPAQLREHRDAFRQGVAHSAPTIEGESAARIGRDGVLTPLGGAPYIEVSKDEPQMVARTSGFQPRFGVDIERQLSLIADGQTLVGRDRLVNMIQRAEEQFLSLSFHLGPGIKVEHDTENGPIELTLRNREVWHFLWEGASARVEESVRQSSHFGFHRTRQIILNCPLALDKEVAWIFTRQAR